MKNKTLINQVLFEAKKGNDKAKIKYVFELLKGTVNDSNLTGGWEILGETSSGIEPPVSNEPYERRK